MLLDLTYWFSVGSNHDWMFACHLFVAQPNTVPPIAGSVAFMHGGKAEHNDSTRHIDPVIPQLDRNRDLHSTSSHPYCLAPAVSANGMRHFFERVLRTVETVSPCPCSEGYPPRGCIASGPPRVKPDRVRLEHSQRDERITKLSFVKVPRNWRLTTGDYGRRLDRYHPEGD